MVQLVCAEVDPTTFVFLEIMPGYRHNVFVDRMFQLTVIHDSVSYSQSLGTDILDPLYRQFGHTMTIAEYLRKTLSAFNNKCCKITHNGQESITLSWVMTIENDLVYTLGNVEIPKDASSRLVTMMSKVIASQGALQVR